MNVERCGTKPFERDAQQPEWAGEGRLAMMVGKSWKSQMSKVHRGGSVHA